MSPAQPLHRHGDSEPRTRWPPPSDDPFWDESTAAGEQGRTRWAVGAAVIVPFLLLAISAVVVVVHLLTRLLG